MGDTKALTPRRKRNQDRVLDYMRSKARPLSAYQILDGLRAEGITAPTTVYRALEQLLARRRVHRVESLNAYLPCCSPDHEGTAVFAICNDCGAVSEEIDQRLAVNVRKIANKMEFDAQQSVIEIRGRCSGCRA